MEHDLVLVVPTRPEGANGQLNILGFLVLCHFSGWLTIRLSRRGPTEAIRSHSKSLVGRGQAGGGG